MTELSVEHSRNSTQGVDLHPKLSQGLYHVNSRPFFSGHGVFSPEVDHTGMQIFVKIGSILGANQQLNRLVGFFNRNLT